MLYYIIGEDYEYTNRWIKRIWMKCQSNISSLSNFSPIILHYWVTVYVFIRLELSGIWKQTDPPVSLQTVNLFSEQFLNSISNMSNLPWSSWDVLGVFTSRHRFHRLSARSFGNVPPWLLIHSMLKCCNWMNSFKAFRLITVFHPPSNLGTRKRLE